MGESMIVWKPRRIVLWAKNNRQRTKGQHELTGTLSCLADGAGGLTECCRGGLAAVAKVRMKRRTIRC